MNDEYILLSDALEIAMQYCPDDDGSCSKADRDVREMLDELETKQVNARPVVQADWLMVSNGSGVCSNCNRIDHIDSLARYCRYCGAEMRGKNE